MTALQHLPAPLAAQLQALLAPPTAPRPAAADERSQRIRLEIDKLGALSGDAPNWPLVADLGAAILRESAKDLLIAAYTALALAKRHGPPGIALGVHALAQLLRTPDLAPTRPKPRAVALGWYIDHLHHVLTDLQPAPEHAPLLRLLPAEIRHLRAAATDILGEHAPSLSPLLKRLDPILLDLPPEPEPAHPPTDVPTDIHQGATDTPPPPAAPSSSTANDRPPSPSPSPATHDLAADRSPSSTPTPTDGSPSPAPSPTDRTISPTTTDPPGPLDALRQAAAPWLAPLSPEAPCGADPSPNESFAELRAEIGKLIAVTDNNVDWQIIDTRSDHLLRTLSKDLRLAAYLTLARHRRAGVPGLALGLVLTADLLDTYPTALHPLQPAGRRKFASWLIDQVAAALRAPIAPLPPPLHATLKAAAARLSAVLQDRLGDGAPSTRPLRDAIAALPVIEPEPEPELADEHEPAPDGDTGNNGEDTVTNLTSTKDPSTTPSPTHLTDSTSGTSARPPTPPTDPSTNETTAPPVHIQAAKSIAPTADLTQLDRFLDDTDDALAKTARALREAIPTDPRAYRLLRIGLWLKLTAPPAAKPDGTTGVSPLPDRDREALHDLAAKQLWPALLQRSENLLGRHRYLLDLQRHSHTALAALGPDYAPAALALRAEVTALLLRFPTLPLLKDRDGTPLADPETQTWLTNQIPTTPNSTKPAPSPLLASPSLSAALPASAAPLSLASPHINSTSLAAPDLADPFWQDLPARLRSAPHPTLLEAQAHLDRSPTGHHRFASALTLAEALLEAGDHQRAAYLFAGLAAEADRHHLDRWDPPLLIRCLQGTARAHHLTNNPQARDTALQRLAPLAPSITTQ